MGAAFLASYALGVPFVAILAGCGVLGFTLGARHRQSSKASPRLFGWLFVLLVAGLVTGARLSPSFSAARSDDPSRAELATSRSGHAPEVLPARLVDVAWVNTKAALVTFGGAYTVLPYLREQTVDRYGWLDDRQVIDALALGETTPGPLISVGIFMSFLAAGLAGAIVGCLFLFLPSFVFVLVLGRYIDRVENLPRARDVLWGFSAGTLGLIVALAANLLASVPDLFAATVCALASPWSGASTRTSSSSCDRRRHGSHAPTSEQANGAAGEAPSSSPRFGRSARRPHGAERRDSRGARTAELLFADGSVRQSWVDASRSECPCSGRRRP
jgi:chromate transport protein ChrA